MNLTTLLRANRFGKMLVLTTSALAFGLWWHFSGDPGAVVMTRQSHGKVLEVFDKVVLIQLDSGEQVRVFRNIDIAPGERVVLTTNTHATGTTYYILNQ